MVDGVDMAGVSERGRKMSPNNEDEEEDDSFNEKDTDRSGMIIGRDESVLGALLVGSTSESLRRKISSRFTRGADRGITWGESRCRTGVVKSVS